MSYEHDVRYDLMSALVEFTKNHDERLYWNGFALYCMEIAVGFVILYEEQFRSPPPGLSPSLLQTKQEDASHRLTVESIKEFVEGRKLNPDLKHFYEQLTGKLHPRIVTEQEKSSQAEAKMKQYKAEKEKEIENRIKLVDSFASQLKEIKTCLASIDTHQSETTRKLSSDTEKLKQEILKSTATMVAAHKEGTHETDRIVAGIERIEKRKKETSDKLISKVEEIQTAIGTEDPMQLKSRIVKLMEMLKGSEAVETRGDMSDRLQSNSELWHRKFEESEASCKTLKSDLDAKTTEISNAKLRIAELEDQVKGLEKRVSSNVGAATDPIALFSKEPQDIMKYCYELSIDEDYSEEAWKKYQDMIEQQIDFNAFSNFGKQIMRYMKNIVRTVVFYRKLMMVFDEYQHRIEEENSVSVFTDILGRRTLDEEVREYFVLLHGFHSYENFKEYFQHNAKSGLDVRKNIFLAIDRIGNDSMDDRFLKIMSSDTKITIPVKDVMDFETSKGQLERTMDHCLIVHLYILLKEVLHGNSINKEKTLETLARVIKIRLNVPSIEFIMKNPMSQNMVKICQGTDHKKFPLLLMHSGVYVSEVINYLNANKTLLYCKQAGTPPIANQLSTMTKAMIDLMKAYPDHVEEMMDDFGPVEIPQ